MLLFWQHYVRDEWSLRGILKCRWKQRKFCSLSIFLKGGIMDKWGKQMLAVWWYLGNTQQTNAVYCKLDNRPPPLSAPVAVLDSLECQQGGYHPPALGCLLACQLLRALSSVWRVARLTDWSTVHLFKSPYMEREQQEMVNNPCAGDSIA